MIRFYILKRCFDFLFFRNQKEAFYLVFVAWLIVLPFGLIALFFRDEVTDPETGNLCLILFTQKYEAKSLFLSCSVFVST